MIRALVILCCFSMLQACYTGYSLSTRPKTYPRTTTVPRRDAGYLQRDEQGCRRYDRKGNRMYHVERAR